MTQADLYTIEEVAKVEGDGCYFRIVKSTSTIDGKTDYRAIAHDDCGDRLPLFPIFSAPKLEQVLKHANDNI